eukprot:1160008-Pelagomonas_calceolata.AAC.3
MVFDSSESLIGGVHMSMCAAFYIHLQTALEKQHVQAMLESMNGLFGDVRLSMLHALAMCMQRDVTFRADVAQRIIWEKCLFSVVLLINFAENGLGSARYNTFEVFVAVCKKPQVKRNTWFHKVGSALRICKSCGYSSTTRLHMAGSPACVCLLHDNGLSGHPPISGAGGVPVFLRLLRDDDTALVTAAVSALHSLVQDHQVGQQPAVHSLGALPFQCFNQFRAAAAHVILFDVDV